MNVFSPFTNGSAENNMFDHEMDSGDNFFSKFSLTDSDNMRIKEQVRGDRFIAKRRLDFESALNFEKKSLILKKEALSFVQYPGE